MNKKLLTAAVVATLSASPAAFAEATIYGFMDVGMQSVSPGSGYSGAKLFTSDTMGSGGSLLGFKASEDLGGGLKALAQMELGFKSDTGELDNTGNKLFQRQEFAGLAGGWGALTVGRQYREIFLTGNRSQYGYTYGNIGTFFLNTTTSVRQDNMVKYQAPNLNGLALEVGFAPGEGTDATGADKKNGQFSEISANWASGPLAVGAAYGSASTEAASVENKEKNTLLGASYKMAPFSVYALYSKGENDVDTDPGNRTAISLNGVYTVGAGDIILVLGTSKSDATGASNDKSKLLALAYYHHLSKSTIAYVSYGSLTNDPGAQMSLARQNVATTAPGEDPTAIDFGVKTSF
jgi:predicted porin